MKMIRFLPIVMTFAALQAFGGVAEQNREKLRQALTKMGGSVATPLVQQLDRQKDEGLSEYDKHVRETVLRNLSGRIGPLKCERKQKSLFVTVPENFREGFDELYALARAGYPPACAEAGAVMFADAVKGWMGVNERTCLAILKKASDANVPDGKFLYAFCCYYGIGAPSNRKLAKRLLTERDAELRAAAKKAGKSYFASSSSWANRRLGED